MNKHLVAAILLATAATPVLADNPSGPYVAVEGAYINMGNPGEKLTATGSNGTYKLHARGECERIDIADYNNSDALWLTAAWRF